MAFMKKNNGKIIVIIFAILIGVSLVGSSIYWSFGGGGVTNYNGASQTQDAQNESNLISVINAYKQALSKNPNDIKTTEDLATYGYFALGNYYLQKGDSKKANEQFALAIAEFDKVIKANPKNVAALGDMATAQFYSGKVDDAIANAKKALEIDPNFTNIRANLGRYLAYGKNDYQGAIAELKKIPSTDPNYQSVKGMIDEFSKSASSSTSGGQGGFTPKPGGGK